MMESTVLYLAKDNNPAITSKETFQAMQIEKKQRPKMVNEGKVKNTVRR